MHTKVVKDQIIGRPRSLWLLAGSIALALAMAVPASAAQQAFLENLVQRVPSDFTPHVLDGRVYSVVEVGDQIVIAGSFTEFRAHNSSVTITDQPYIVAFNRFNGQINSQFRPSFDDEIETLVASEDDQAIFAGGSFRELNGEPKRNVAKIEFPSGQAVDEFGTTTAGRVRHMALRGDRLFLSGVFGEVNGQARQLLAEVDPTSGDLRDTIDFDFDGHKVNSRGAGRPTMLKFDVSADGSTLVGIGNFGSVDGLQREQIVMVDLLSNPARVEDWHTRDFRQRTTNPDHPVQNWCSSSFASYMRHVDISPDGSYFTVNTTGAARYPRLCDSTTRWDITARGSDQSPEWINYTGGDTLYAVANTGHAAYVGGHFRWTNNPYGSDSPGAGSVPREGLAALDVRNGLPFSWDPGRALGVGVFDLLATDQGLWMGHDTARVAWRQQPRITHFPTQGGTLPADSVGPIPGELFNVSADGSGNPSILHRINVGGEAALASDGGIEWSQDTNSSPSPRRVAGGGQISSFGGAIQTNDSVPAATPSSVFSTYRWDPPQPPEMRWEFPVEEGREVDVRLYFHTSWDGASEPGQRVFDVTIDGETVLEDYDIVAEDGFRIGTMKDFRVESDGLIDIEFLHGVENPLINAIEIVDPALADEEPELTGLTGRGFDGEAFEADNEPFSGGLDWSLARGSFMLSGTLYSGWADGRLYAEAFDGTNLGQREEVDLRGLSPSRFDVANVSGMAFDQLDGRLYYTRHNQNRLYYRYFTHESQVVGAEEYTAVTGSSAGVDWSAVRGMHLDRASDTLYVGEAAGDLRRVEFRDGRPVDGTIETVSGPAVDGRAWNGRSLFAFAEAGYRAPNLQPEANVRFECELLTCRFASVGSHDPDGWIESFSWSTSDGGSGSEHGFEHTFPAQGSYEVALTVTDNDGATGSTTVEVDVADPIADIDVQCDALECTFDGSASVDVDDSIEEYSWSFGDGAVATGETVEHAYSEAGSYEVELEVVNARGNRGNAARTIQVGSPRDEITYLGRSTDSGNKSTFEVSVPENVRPGDSLLIWASSNREGVGTPVPQGVSGWTELDSVVSSGNLRSTLWHKVAEPGDEGSAVTIPFEIQSKSEVALLAYGGVDAETPIDRLAANAETVYRAEHTTPAVVTSAAEGVIVSYWADRTSETESWSTPETDTVRYLGVGTGPGRVTATVTDQGPVEPGVHGAKTAVASTANNSATMWTVALAPRGFDRPEAVGPAATLDSDCEGLSCEFSATGSVPGSSPIVDYEWEFGDGDGASGTEVSHTFAGSGTYEVRVTVTDENGATDTASREVTVAGPPTARVDVTCEELTCTFDGSASSAGSGDLAEFAWEFSDDTSLDGPVVEKTFAESGNYTVSLTVRDTDGGIDTATVSFAVAEAVEGVERVAAVGHNRHQTNHPIDIPSDVAANDGLVLIVSVARDVELDTLTDADRWQLLADERDGALRTWVLQSVAGSDDAGSQIVVGLSDAAKTDVSLVAYRGVSAAGPVTRLEGAIETTSRADHTTPVIDEPVEDAHVLSYWADRSSSTAGWIAPEGVEPLHAGVGQGGGRVAALLGEQEMSEVPYGGLTAMAVTAENEPSSSPRATMFTMVIGPGE